MPSDETLGPIACPKCSKPMHHVHSGEVTVDQCHGCGGFWLDSLELERLVAAGTAGKLDTLKPSSGGEARPGPLTCPRDKSRLIPMTALNQPQVRYESCNTCGGMFLDAGELADLGSVSLGERLRKVFSFG